jgi:hypothetical protein
MLSVTVNQASIAAIKKTIADLGFNVRKQVAIAVNDTVSKCKFEASKELGKILPVPAKILKKTVGQSRRANERRLEAVMILREGYEFPLKFFRPRKSKKGVLTITLDKRIKGKKGRTTLPGAFFVQKKEGEPMFAGNVFQRMGPKQTMTKGRYKDKIRQPIEKMFGPGPGQAFKDADIANLVVAVGKRELQKQILERVRYLTEKANGNLRGKQK